MSVKLEQVTEETFIPCAKLEVDEGQKKFVASNLFTIAEAYVNIVLTPYTVMAGDQVVGMLALERILGNEIYNRYWIPRMMIGKGFQGKGYGKQAMKLAIELLAKEPDCERIRLSVVPENEEAIAFYERLGFKFAGQEIEGESVMDDYIN